MIEGLVVFTIVAVATVYAVRHILAERGEDGGCNHCDLGRDQR